MSVEEIVMAKKKSVPENVSPSKEAPPLVRAHLILHGSLPAYLSPAPTAKTMRATESLPTSEESSKQLKKLGFNVLSISPLAISVEASPETFQTVFGSPLVSRQTPRSTKAMSYTLPETLWQFQQRPQIPEPLRLLVQEVVFPAAAALH